MRPPVCLTDRSQLLNNLLTLIVRQDCRLPKIAEFILQPIECPDRDTGIFDNYRGFWICPNDYCVYPLLDSIRLEEISESDRVILCLTTWIGSCSSPTPASAIFPSIHVILIVA